jgi:hypothetical protein
MPVERMEPEDVFDMLQDMAERIERGGLKSATIRAMTREGEMLEHTFPLETEEDQNTALLFIRKLLGQVH